MQRLACLFWRFGRKNGLGAWVLNRAYFVIGQFDLKKDFTGSLQNQ
jgi:hypothetical protein